METAGPGGVEGVGEESAGCSSSFRVSLKGRREVCGGKLALSGLEHPDDREKWVPWSAGKCWTLNLGVGAADTKQGQVGEEKASRRQGASKTL